MENVNVKEISIFYSVITSHVPHWDYNQNYIIQIPVAEKEDKIFRKTRAFTEGTYVLFIVISMYIFLHIFSWHSDTHMNQ